MIEAEKYVMLRSVNDLWMEHLQMIEYIREGIGLRGYGQVDPLVAYKRETYDTFQGTLKRIREQASKMIFHIRIQPEVTSEMMMGLEGEAAEMLMQELPADAPKAEPGTLPWPEGTDPKKVGRNDACPCGSGLKFKACHYSVVK